MVANWVNSMERNGWTLRVAVSLICQREVLNLDDFQFSYFDMDLQESQ